MPCLNEAETLETCIRKAIGFLEQHNVSGEVVIGDNGSTDGSQAIARRCGARVIDVPIRGYGAALYYATLAARGKYVIMGDSDDSYDFSSLSLFVEKLREGYDLVMGNRFKGGIRTGAMPWKNRWIGNPILTGIGNLFFKCPASDFHCGMRGYSVAAFKKMDLQTTGMEYASEMVIKSTLLGLKIAEVPTTLDPDGRSRPPHLRPWTDGWRHLRFMLLYSPRWLFLYPGIFLMLAGSLAMARLVPGPIFIGRIGLDIQTMLYSAIAVLIGYQAVTFAIFAKVFAISEGLLPPDHRLNKLGKHITLEHGLVIGVVLFLSGLLGSITPIIIWSKVSFGHLDPSDTLRAAIPSLVALTLGVETILGSFFLSVLGLRTRHTNTTNRRRRLTDETA
ncbi:MAG TPA: glycosyltransferase family 2 protein [Blastocatellia bacterium]|nr:glycosyltransferase family 2 protein [Blastocatellia bacterium]